MKKRNLYILVFLLMGAIQLRGQEYITADQTGGCDSLAVQFSLQEARMLSEYASVKWNFGDGTEATGILEPLHLYVNPGMYEVSCELDGARELLFADKIIVSETPYAYFKYSDTSLLDTEYKYFFFPAYFKPIEGLSLNYQWKFHDGTVLTDSTVTFSFEDNGSYFVEMRVSDQNGCADSVIQKVPVYKELLVPNVFSPNGDDMNDHFEVMTTGEYLYTLRIFSNGGLQLFKSESPLIRWDGRSLEGRELPEGVYFYTIESAETPSATSLSGFIHLFK